MNILILTPDYPPVYGGIGTHVDFLTKALAKQGNDITIIITRISGDTQLNSNKIVRTFSIDKLMVIDIPSCSSGFLKDRGIYIDKYYRKEVNIVETYGDMLNEIFKVLPKKTFDIIHMHDGYAGFVGKILSQYLNVPLVTTIHSMHADKTSVKYYLREYAVNNSNYVIAVSHFIKNKILQNYHISKELTKVIHNSISVESNTKEGEQEKLYEISFCGRFEEIKGVITLISVFAEILSEKIQSIKNNQIILNLIGDGSLKDTIMALVKRLKIGDNVRLYSNIKNKKVLDILEKSCCVVIPSREEPFATVGLEAMSVKTAVICSDVGGMSEMVVHNVTGYVYDVNNQTLLKNYIIDLLSNPEKTRKFGEAGYERIKKYFTWECNVNKVLETYHLAIKNYT